MLPHNNKSVAIMRKPARRGVISRGSGSSRVGSLLAVSSDRSARRIISSSTLTNLNACSKTVYLTSPSETTGSVSRLKLLFCDEAKMLRGEL